ncbi:MAG: tetratricopeptide repeat protein [Acidobacteriota bacterium]
MPIFFALTNLVSLLVIGGLSQADQWFEQAQEFFARQRWAEARSAATKTLELDPNFADAEILLGLIASAQQQLGEAETHLKRAVDLQPSNPQAHSYLASNQLQQQKLPEAEAGFRRVLRLAPDNLVAHYNLGLTCLLRQKPQEALAHFERVRQLQPSDIAALIGLLESQLLLKKPTATAVAQLSKLLDDRDPRLLQVGTMLAVHRAFDSAIPILERVSRSVSDSYEAWYNLALAYLGAGESESAARVLHELPANLQRAESLNLLGQVEETRQRRQEALMAFKRAAELEPANESYQFDYANALLQGGQVAEALIGFEQSLLQIPNSWQLQIGLGAAQYLMGQYENAAASLLKAAVLQPKSQVAFDLLGRVYEQVSEHRQAIHLALQRYATESADDPSIHYHLGHISYLEAQSTSQPDYLPAIRHLERALELKPDLAAAQLELAVVFQAQGQLERSVALLEKLANTAPDLPSVRYRLALAYQRLGQREKAAAQFALYERLKAASPEQSEVRAAVSSLATRSH